MPRYEGEERRTNRGGKPRVNVLRGYAGNEPQSITRSAPIKSGEVIWSGMAIALEAGEWIKGVSGTGTSTGPTYVAYHDHNDTDVAASGKLMAFSSLGSFELETCQVTTTVAEGLAVGEDLHALSTGLFDNIGGTKVGVITGIVDLGTAGHTTSNVRGGAPGTIAEDSTGVQDSADKLFAVQFVTTAA
jgi:hypothetical protein